jgi:hypothetical protein
MPQVQMFILVRLNQHVSGIIMPIVRRTDYVNNCMWCMPGCVGCSSAELRHELCALCESWYNNFHTTRHTPHAVVYIVCSPDDGHKDARNMLI